MVGIPSLDINTYREGLRTKMAYIGLPVYEPYKNNILHVSILRWTQKPTIEETNRALEIARRYSEMGTISHLYVTRLLLSRASWLMRPEELPRAIDIKLQNFKDILTSPHLEDTFSIEQR
jgi:hypothetical protein